MGSSKKKKKRGGSARRNKGKADYTSQVDDENELLVEEVTALRAIFEEDCKIVSGSPPQIIIKIRPYSKDMGYEDLDVSAELLVRCLPGYPFKCPKLQVSPEKGLTQSDADNLLSLLQDQANANARDGRVMIFNLVEAAQEFLSEISPIGQAVLSSTISSLQLLQDKAESRKKTFSTRGPYVYGFIDLFSGCGESWHWGCEMEENRGITTIVESHEPGGLNLKYGIPEKNHDKPAKSHIIQDSKQGPSHSLPAPLDVLEEESEDDSRSTSIIDSSGSQVDEGNFAEGDGLEDDDSDFGSEASDSPSSSFTSPSHDQLPQVAEKDLIMVHMLRLACSSKGVLTDSLPQVAAELCNLGIFSESVRDLASKPSSLFNKTFNHFFHQHMASSKLSQFWKSAYDLGEPSTSLGSSRYLNDFDEIQPLGHGGFGHVVLCKNKLDGRQYAMKKIRLKDKILPLNDRILREVATLSRLQHLHVVRYYQAWFETGAIDSYGDSASCSETMASSTFSYKGASSSNALELENKLESTYLYIQMEYCPRTLKQVFEAYNHFDTEYAWHLFRQIVEGLAHIHGQGIIHRDLTPSNIFFDARNDIKIGDFGLAKFLKLEQLDQDVGFPTDVPGVSTDGTGQVGTYFYTAPEIEQRWPKIDEKADMYSLGVLLFELWHPFGTAMERHIILSDLKLKGELPSSWVTEFPEQASLLKRLMCPSPSDRPSATELLQHAFPPRMEYEQLDNFLRTMHTSEDTSVYDKVVNSIFDEEMLSKSHNQHVDRLTMTGDDGTSSIQCSEVDSEVRDSIVEITRKVFRQHSAKHLEIVSMHLLDDCPQFNRNTVKLLTHGGDMVELCHELRFPFANWVIANQKLSFRRYEISYVYRRAIGRSPPNRYLQGDFDIIGGTPALTEAEVIKVTMDIVTRFIQSDFCDIHLNHGDLLNAIWSWVGVKENHVQKVAELLSLMVSLRPQSPERKSKWVVIRRQLLQELKLEEAVVNRLQTVGLRFCGPVDQALPRLRGALPADKTTRKALDELSDLFSFLRVWKIEKHVYIDALVPPTESYHRDLFFQIFLVKDNHPGSIIEGALLAIGGRYDYLLHQMWDQKYKTNSPCAVGTSLALETLILHSSGDYKPIRNEANTNVLVCSKGGGGLLVERMELVAELWEENIKAEFVPVPDPSFTEQYEYATEHDIKCLATITDTGVSQTGFVKVRHIELKKEKEVQRENLVGFLTYAMATQFRDPSVWMQDRLPQISSTH